MNGSGTLQYVLVGQGIFLREKKHFVLGMVGSCLCYYAYRKMIVAKSLKWCLFIFGGGAKN